MGCVKAGTRSLLSIMKETRAIETKSTYVYEILIECKMAKNASLSLMVSSWRMRIVGSLSHQNRGGIRRAS